MYCSFSSKDKKKKTKYFDLQHDAFNWFVGWLVFLSLLLQGLRGRKELPTQLGYETFSAIPHHRGTIPLARHSSEGSLFVRTHLVEAEAGVGPVGLSCRTGLSLQLQGTLPVVGAFVGLAGAGAAAGVGVRELRVLLLAPSRQHGRALSDQELNNIVQPHAVIEQGVTIFHLQGKHQTIWLLPPSGLTPTTHRAQTGSARQDRPRGFKTIISH